MARQAGVEDDELVERLAGVFCDVGFEGASLATLSAATGLQRASLYHRFPEGKQQMAEEALRAAVDWVGDHVIAPLTKAGEVRDRWAAARRNLDAFYDGGRKSCLLNMLTAPRGADGPVADMIQAAFAALIGAFAQIAHDAGAPKRDAERIGQRAVMLIQGGLVVARGLRSTRPFKDALAALEAELFPDKKGV